MRWLWLSAGLVVITSAGLAQEPLCNPCVDPPRQRPLVPEVPPLLTAADIPRQPVPMVTAELLRRLTPEEAVRRLTMVLEARGETEMVEELRKLEPDDAVSQLLASWGALDEQQDTDAAAGDEGADPASDDAESSNR